MGNDFSVLSLLHGGFLNIVRNRRKDLLGVVVKFLLELFLWFNNIFEIINVIAKNWNFTIVDFGTVALISKIWILKISTLVNKTLVEFFNLTIRISAVEFKLPDLFLQ